MFHCVWMRRPWEMWLSIKWQEIEVFGCYNHRRIIIKTAPMFTSSGPYVPNYFLRPLCWWIIFFSPYVSILFLMAPMWKRIFFGPYEIFVCEINFEVFLIHRLCHWYIITVIITDRELVCQQWIGKILNCIWIERLVN